MSDERILLNLCSILQYSLVLLCKIMHKNDVPAKVGMVLIKDEMGL